MAIDREYDHYQVAPQRPPEDNLFTTFGDRVQLRVVDVLDNRNVFAPASDEAKKVLRCLQSRMGASHAISRADLVARVKLSDRVIRKLVHELRANFGVQIGADRAEDGGGYYLLDDEADSKQASEVMVRQGLEIIRAGVALLGPNASMTEVTRRIGLALHEGRPVRSEGDHI